MTCKELVAQIHLDHFCVRCLSFISSPVQCQHGHVDHDHGTSGNVGYAVHQTTRVPYMYATRMTLSACRQFTCNNACSIHL